MQHITQIVDSLEDKLLLLLERYNFLQEENEVLRSDLTQLQLELAKKDEIIQNNESNQQAMRVAQTIQGSNNNTRETSQKINTLIKEIDKCIAQLSD